MSGFLFKFNLLVWLLLSLLSLFSYSKALNFAILHVLAISLKVLTEMYLSILSKSYILP